MSSVSFFVQQIIFMHFMHKSHPWGNLIKVDILIEDLGLLSEPCAANQKAKAPG